MIPDSAPFESGIWYSALPVLVAAATFTWLLSLPLRSLNVAGPMWSLMLFAAGVTYALHSDPRAPRLALVLWLLALWAARLSVFLVIRDAGKQEDPRFERIRLRHQPRFALKSLYRVFWPRAVLAWMVSLPLMGAFASIRPIGAFDYAAALLWTCGFVVETVADWQLARFQRDPANAGSVMRRGLWRHSRHPNYFGECCVWWGFGLMAVAAGAWWALAGPALLTGRLWWAARTAANDPGNRRPQYADYVLKTNAFFPGPPRK